MMAYTIHWFNPNTGIPYVSIASYGLTFNKTASEELGNPTRIQIGIDAAQSVLLVKPLHEVDAALEKTSFPYAGRERSGQTRVSSRDLINYIELTFPELQLDSTVRYAAKWEESEQLLIVDLKNPVSSPADEDKEAAAEQIANA